MAARYRRSLIVLAALGAAACGGVAPSSGTAEPTESGPSAATRSTDFTPSPSGIALLASDTPRDRSPDVADADLTELVAGNTDFAAALYRTLDDGSENLLLGPHSASVGLAMVLAGAEGATASQLATALQLDLADERLHGAFNQLDLELATRNNDDLTLAIANRAFGQTGYEFLDGYVELLARDYSSPFGTLDFASDPELARQAINKWVAAQTRERIEELFPAGTIDPNTQLALVDAVYLDASWHFPFNAELTESEPFHRLDGAAVSVPTMHFNEYLPSGFGAGWSAVEIPYTGGELSMVVIVPEDLRTFESRLDGELLREVFGSLTDGGIHLALPRFSFGYHASLVQPLRDLGVAAAFDDANFSGMTGTRALALAAVEHATFIRVNEEGTEAAAATGSAMRDSHGPTVTVDRPFVFAIRDRVTGTVLFLGRVTDPGAAA